MKQFLIFLQVAFCCHVVTAQTNISFPLKHSENHHYLIDHKNRPVFLHGASPWALGYKLSIDEVKQYLQDRKDKGFNALLFQITPSNASVLEGGARDENMYGDLPNINNERVFFNQDISTPNESYFKHLDTVIALCNEMNFAVLLAPLYQGCCEDGWKEILDKDPESVYKAYNYGKWVATRYKDFPNIIWVSGGDHSKTPQALAVADGIAAVDAVHLHTFHGDPGYSSLDQLPAAKWLTLDMVYTYFPALPSSRLTQQQVYSIFFHEWQKDVKMPVFLGESAYEYERSETTQTLRRQAYWSLLSGASGQFFGQKDIWSFGKAWKKGLNTPGVQSMEIFGSFVQSIPWYKMQPDWTELVFVSGRGQFNGGTNAGGNDYATAMVSDDKNIGVIYIPDFRTVGINMGRFLDAVTAQWFDPSNGTYTNVKGTFDNNGVQYFSPPKRKNHQGFEDWVLIVKNKTKN